MLKRFEHAIRVASKAAYEMAHKLDDNTPPDLGFDGLTAEQLVASERKCWFEKELRIMRDKEREIETLFASLENPVAPNTPPTAIPLPNGGGFVLHFGSNAPAEFPFKNGTYSLKELGEALGKIGCLGALQNAVERERAMSDKSA